MSEATLTYKLGRAEFSATGNEHWVEARSSEFLERLKVVDAKDALFEPSRSVNNDDVPAQRNNIPLGPFLKQKGASTNQVKKFLVTAIWLHGRGAKTLTTSDISRALTDNHQKRLGNASECLARNIAKGFCEKAGDGFYVTQEGMDEGNVEGESC